MPLSTYQEVSTYGPSDHVLSRKAINNLLPHVEAAFFRQLLTEELYDLMLANMVNYSKVQYYQDSVSYSTGDRVQFNGVVYDAQVPVFGITPTDQMKWSKQPKFSDPTYEALYTGYIRACIAWAVCQNTVVYDWLKQAAEGFGKLGEDKAKAASMAEVRLFKAELGGDIDLIVANMKSWLTKNPVTGYTVPATATGTDCTTSTSTTKPGKPRKNYGFQF